MGPLEAGLGVGDDGERRHLGARARRGRDGHEVGLLAHLGEGEDALADVHEVHGHVLEVRLGVLVHEPHDLAGVHGRAAADRDDEVGLEQAACAPRRCIGVLQARVGLDVVEGSRARRPARRASPRWRGQLPFLYRNWSVTMKARFLPIDAAELLDARRGVQPFLK